MQGKKEEKLRCFFVSLTIKLLKDGFGANDISWLRDFVTLAKYLFHFNGIEYLEYLSLLLRACVYVSVSAWSLCMHRHLELTCSLMSYELVCRSLFGVHTHLCACVYVRGGVRACECALVYF